MNYIIEKLKKENLTVVRQLLNDVNLPSDDIDEHWKTFLVAKVEDEIIGAIGLELWKYKALLRSLVVKKEFRKLGLGKELYNKCIELAKRNNVTEIGLLTNTAEEFFAKRGFKKIMTDNIPDFIKQTTEFKIYCPSSSAIMIKNL